MPGETFLRDGGASGTKSCAEDKYNDVPGMFTVYSLGSYPANRGSQVL